MALTAKSMKDVRPDVPVKTATKSELVRVNIQVPASVRVEWKTSALQRGQSLQDLIIEAVNTHLNK